MVFVNNVLKQEGFKKEKIVKKESMLKKGFNKTLDFFVNIGKNMEFR